MDEQRIQDYLYLIQELLRCSPGREGAVLSDNPDLLDNGLVEMMKQMAAAEKNLKIAKRLNALANQVDEKLNPPSRDNPEDSVDKSQLNFISKVLQAIVDSKVNPQVVYPLFLENIDKLNGDFAQALKVWADRNFQILEPKEAQEAAGRIMDFSCLIQQFPLGNRASNLEIAIIGHQQVLRIYTRETFLQYWIRTHINLADAYINRIEGDKADNIEKAIAACQKALQICTREAFPQDWANAYNNVGLAYFERIQGEKASNIEMAINAYQKCFQVYTPETFPQQWAKSYSNLASAYIIRIEGSKKDNIESAIDALKKVLLVFNSPSRVCAMSQTNLASAYYYRIEGDKEENLEKAIAALKEALQFYTYEAFPQKWAMIQNNIGLVYTDRIKLNKADNLEKAIECFQQALRVYTYETIRQKWAKTNHNLGIAYSKGDLPSNIEQGIAAFKRSLQVRTREALPENWARTQFNLGNAYSKRSEGDKAENLEEAIYAFQQALEIFSHKKFPQDWALIQNSLGLAYQYRIKGDRAKNIEQGISAYQRALDVYTPEADPINCLQTSRNLGNLHFTQGNWQPAIDTYEKAIAAVELSRSWANTDDRRQQIIAEAIEVYQKLVQAYINTKQWDKAIETVERSKARNLVELLTNRDLYPKGDVPQEIIAQLKELRGKIPSLERRLQVATDQLSGNSDEQQRPSLEESQKRLQQELQESRQQLDEVLNQIKPFDSDFSLTQEVVTIPFRDIQSLIDEQTATIQWYFTDDSIITSIITRHSSQPTIISSSAEEQKAFVNCANKYLDAYYEQNQEWKNDLSSHLAELAEILKIDRTLAEIDGIFARKRIKCDRLILVPHRFLHLLPLHTLPLANGDLVCDKFPQGVSYAPSCQLLQLTQKRDRPDFNHLFAVQDPEENLAYSILEVESVRSFFSPATVLARKDAREAEVKTHPELSLAHCNHFSCHGEFNLKSPLESALRLAEIQQSDQKPSEDGLLTLAEIFALNLTQSRLVTLSACETGIADPNSISDEYVSLPSGFLFAGSPTVVSSLWKADDFSTSLLMMKFYENLQLFPLRENGSVALALNQAQKWLRNLTCEDGETFLDSIEPQWKLVIANLPEEEAERVTAAIKGARKRMLKRPPYPFANPYYWAAFTATGF